MDYCGPIGLAHSQFLTWDIDDQDKAMAWSLVKLDEEAAHAARCKQCGTLPDEWLDEEGRDREPPPYVAKSILCVGCHTIEDKISEIPEAARLHTHVYLTPYVEEEEDGISDRQDRTTG